ncbi:MAG: hypothetical protein ACK5KT_11475 [Dysgonomonas sp.]
MKTTEKIMKELGLILLLFVAIVFLVRSIISYRKETSGQISRQDNIQMQEMEDYHRSQGRQIQLY